MGKMNFVGCLSYLVLVLLVSESSQKVVSKRALSSWNSGGSGAGRDNRYDSNGDAYTGFGNFSGQPSSSNFGFGANAGQGNNYPGTMNSARDQNIRNFANQNGDAYTGFGHFSGQPSSSNFGFGANAGQRNYYPGTVNSARDQNIRNFANQVRNSSVNSQHKYFDSTMTRRY